MYLDSISNNKYAGAKMKSGFPEADLLRRSLQDNKATLKQNLLQTVRGVGCFRVCFIGSPGRNRTCIFRIGI